MSDMTIITVKIIKCLFCHIISLFLYGERLEYPVLRFCVLFFSACFNLGTFVCYHCKAFFFDIVNHSSITLITLVYLSDVFVSHILTSCKVISFQEKWLPNSVQNIYIHKFSSLIIFLEI